jgi:hypothetical protein
MANENEYSESRTDWWKNRRRKYNVGLVISGITAFILNVIIGSLLIAPYDYEFEITLFTIGFQGTGYLIMMGVANQLYNLGPWADINYNKNNDLKFRQNLFNLGFWFSVSLPFAIPLVLVLTYLISYKK